MKKAKVIKAEFNGNTWESKFGGMLYDHDIEMENGDKGVYASRFESQDKFVVGHEVEYEFKGGDFPKIKPISTFKPFPSGTNTNYTKPDTERQELIVKQSSLKAAVDLCIAQGIYGSEDVLSRAEAFTDWVMNRNQTAGLSFTDNKSPF